MSTLQPSSPAPNNTSSSSSSLSIPSSPSQSSFIHSRIQQFSPKTQLQSPTRNLINAANGTPSPTNLGSPAAAGSGMRPGSSGGGGETRPSGMMQRIPSPASHSNALGSPSHSSLQSQQQQQSLGISSSMITLQPKSPSSSSSSTPSSLANSAMPSPLMSLDRRYSNGMSLSPSTTSYSIPTGGRSNSITGMSMPALGPGLGSPMMNSDGGLRDGSGGNRGSGGPLATPPDGSPIAFGRRASRSSISINRSDSPGLNATSSASSASVNDIPPHSTANPAQPYDHRLANAPNNGEPDFESLDEQLSKSSVFRELHRIVRMCAAQPSCDRMVMTLERQTKYLVGAHYVRLFLVQRDGLVHYSRTQPFNLNYGIVGYVRQKKEIVNLHFPASDERYQSEIDSIYDRPIPQALMCVPIEADSRPDAAGGKDIVAIFQAIKEKEHDTPFTTRDCKVLYRLGEFVGNMLRNSRSVDRAHALYNASLQSHKRSAALLDVAKTLASETQLDKVVGIIVSQVPELLDADRCTLFFVDRERGELIVSKGASKGRAKNLVSWIYGQSNAPELPFPKNCNELRMSIHQGIAGHVALTGETLNVVDAHQDQRFNSMMDKETGYRTRSILCVPMIDARGDTIGVVQCINKNPMFPRFDQQDETLLKTFAAQAALAVRNAQLFMKTIQSLQQSDALLEVTKALSQELKIEALIQIICSKVQVLLNSERCTLFILDKERKELYTSEHMSFGVGAALPIDKEKAKLIYFPSDRGIAGSVATTLQPVNIPDAYKDSRFDKTMDRETGFRTRSILCMAIANHRNECVGVLQILNRVEGTFDESDEKLLSAFCAQAAVAIENSRLFDQTERALNHALADQRNMKFMLSVTKNLFSDMHLTSMIDQMTMQVHHLLKADDCAVYLVDDTTEEFWLAKDDSGAPANANGNGGTSASSPAASSTSSADQPPSKKYSFNTGIVGVVASTGETIRISSGAHLDPRFNSLVDQRKGKVTHSILCCPIRAELPDNGNTKIVGVISVRDEKDRGGFEAEEEKLLRVFCSQAAIAIMNSKRFATIMDQAEIKTSDHSASDYLKQNRGMKLASDDILQFNYKMDDIKIRGAIGTGSYGEVYKAEVNGGQVVAVKKLHVRNLKAEQVDAFCKEASLMCQLNHTNIVGFIGAVTEPSNLSIITQYCSRGSLADLLLDDRIWMNFRVKVKFALEAAQGMNYLHSSNPVILHRDLKSDNLLVTSDWTIKVADFGLTRFISEKKQMTQVGTPMWMAPEIIMGKKYHEKADVYAFGIILWEILTRLEPYEEKEPMQIVVEVVNDGLRPTMPADCIDSPLVPLMKDCWHTSPDQRPSFEKIVERLKLIQAAIPADDNSPAGVPGTSLSKSAAASAGTHIAGDVNSPTG